MNCVSGEREKPAYAVGNAADPGRSQVTFIVYYSDKQKLPLRKKEQKLKMLVIDLVSSSNLKLKNINETCIQQTGINLQQVRSFPNHFRKEAFPLEFHARVIGRIHCRKYGEKATR